MKKSGHQHSVEMFMHQAEQEVPEKPTFPDEKTRRLRAELIMEEALETVNALGFNVIEDYGHNVSSEDFELVSRPTYIESELKRLVEIADGCADLGVVLTGTLSACGLGDKEIRSAVDLNNLQKFMPGHTFSDSGKLIKPPNHVSVTKRLEEIILEGMKETSDEL